MNEWRDVIGDITDIILDADTIMQMILSVITVTIPCFFEKAAYWNWGKKTNRYRMKKIRKNYFILILGILVLLQPWEDGAFENEWLNNIWNWIYSKILIFRRSEIGSYFAQYKWFVCVIFLFVLHAAYHIYQMNQIEKEDRKGLLKTISSIKILENILSKLKKMKDTLPYQEMAARISEKWEAYEQYEGIKKGDESKVYILKDDYVQIRELYKWMFIGAVCVVFLVAGWFKIVPEMKIIIGEEIAVPTAEGFRFLALLVALATYLMEQYGYYNGFTKEEYLKSLEDSSMENAVKSIEYIKLGESFKVIKENQAQGDAFAKKRNRIDRINKLYGSSENRLHCLGIALKDVVDDLCSDNDLIDAAGRLMKHESVYFAVPFYQDLGNYIFPFLSMELLENKKVLVISGIKNRDDELKQWFSKGLQKKYGYLEFWDVQNMQDEIGGADIGLISLGHINKIVDNKENGFWNNISTVILLEPSLFIPYHPIIISQILTKISGGKEKITYIVCDVNTGGMIDLLSDMLDEQFVYVNVAKRGSNTVGAIVDTDKVGKDNPFVRVNPCFANELHVATALRKHFNEKVHWYGNYVVPITDMAWQIGQYYDQITDKTDEISNMGSLNEIFDYKEDGNEAVYEKIAINIVEDSLYNAFELVRQYDTRGEEKTFTAVFSMNYMLRDFMKDEKYARILEKDVGYIAQHMPRFQHSRRNLAIDIAYRLTKESMEIYELEKILFYYGYLLKSSVETVLDDLNVFYKKILNIPNLTLRQIYEKKEGEDWAYSRILAISEEGRNNFLDWYRENIAIVQYYNETTKNQNKYLDAVAGGHVYQFYLPGQYIIVEGKYYKIEKIEKRNTGRCLILQKSSDDYTHRRYYRQFRHYFLDNIRRGNDIKLNREHLIVEMLEADVKVCTDGYICGKQFHETFNADIMYTDNIPERVYKKKSILRIEIKAGNIYTYALLLKELLFTFFPHCWQLLSIAMIDKDRLKGLKGHIDQLEVESVWMGNVKDEFYIIEDSPMDLGLLETISNKFDDLLEQMADYAEWGRGRGTEQMRRFWGSLYLYHPEFMDLNSIAEGKKLLFNVYQDFT